MAIRRIPLNVVDVPGNFVESARSTALATLPDFIQGDTYQFAVTKLTPAPADGTSDFRAYVSGPWSFSSIRVSLGYIDKAPQKGTFKLHVDGVGDTTLLTLPDLTNEEAVATFKTAVIAAINVVAGPNAARNDDPVGTLAHFLYITWTNPTDERALTLVEPVFVPAIDTEEAVQVLQGTPAFQHLLKFERLPVKMATDFDFENPPSVEIEEDVPGATGTDAVQLIIVPDAAVGAFDLLWNGARTRPLAVGSTLTAAAIAEALNAIVPAGATSPSFAVSLRSKGRYAVQFINALGGAVQDLLVRTMRDQAPTNTAVGMLELTKAACERVLNGQPSTTLTFEFVMTSGGAESTILRTVTLVNDMTSGGTVESVEEAGAILTRDRVIFLTADEGDAYMEAAPGVSFVPTGAGNILSITHDLDTWRPQIKVTLHEVNHTTFAGDPTDLLAATTGSHPIAQQLLGVHSGSASQVTVTLPFSLVSDPASNYDYRLLKVDVSSPDTALRIFLAQVLWDNCLQAPMGLTLTAKLAAIEAAIGMVSGALSIPASAIIGAIAAAQLDLTSIAAALVNNAAFATSFGTLVQNNSALLSTLATSIAGSSQFSTALTQLFTTNTTLTNTLGGALAQAPDFLAQMRELVFSVLQGGGNLPDGTTLMLVDDVFLSIPAPQEIRGPSITRTVPITVEDTVTTDGNSSKTARVDQTTVTDATAITVYAALAPAIVTASAGGDVATLPDSPVANRVYHLTADARSRHSRGRRGQVFAAGSYVACDHGFWYELIQLGSSWYAKECERTLADFTVDDTELYLGTRFESVLPIFFKLNGNVDGRVNLLAEIRTFGGSFTQIFSNAVHVSPVNRFRKFGVVIQRAANGTLTGSYKLQGIPTAFTPPSANFQLRFRLTKAMPDTATNGDARGSLSLTMKAASASIVAL